MIIRLKVTFEVDRDTIIPPFSSKVSRSIISILCPRLEPLLNSKSPFKPLSVSPVFLKGRPLLKYGREGSHLILFPGNVYSFYMTLTGKKYGDLLSDLSSSESLELFGSSFKLRGTSALVQGFDRVIIEDGEYYKIRFLTPTILTLPASMSKYGHERHLLFPHAFLIFYSLVRHWNLYAPRELMFFDPYRLASYAYYNFMEVDYSIRPKTVVYDGRRRPRGFVGWAVFRKVQKRARLDEMLRRLLAYADLIGVGRSRSIGFGMVKVDRIGATVKSDR